MSVWLKFKPTNSGVFEASTGRYVRFAQTDDNNYIIIEKSDNQGQNWSLLSTISGFQPAGVGFSHFENDVLYFAIITGTSISFMYYNVASATYGSINGTASTGLDKSGVTAMGYSAKSYTQTSTVNADLLFSAPTASSMGTAYRRIGLVRVVNGVAQTQVTFPSTLPVTTTDYDLRGVLKGDGGRTHVFYTYSSQTSNLYHVCIKSDGTQTTPQVVSSNLTGITGINFPLTASSRVNSNGFTELMLFVGFYDGFANRTNPTIFTAISSDTPTWTSRLTTTTDVSVTSYGSNNGSATYANGMYHAFYVDISLDLYYKNDKGTGDWSTPFVLVDGIPTGNIEGFYVNPSANGNSLLFMFQLNNSGVITLNFGEMSLISNTNLQITLIDSFVISDLNIGKLFNKRLDDTITFADNTINKLTSKNLFDTLPIIDSKSTKGFKSLSDTITISDLPIESNITIGFPPTVTIISVSHNKISGQEGINSSIITFKFDVDVSEWRVNVIGSSWDTGLLADSGGGIVTAGTEITAIVDWTELYQEGANRINIYGKNASGWTAYE
jgi:hypothetical protein